MDNINFIGNNIGDEGAKDIATALKINTSLQILQLESK